MSDKTKTNDWYMIEQSNVATRVLLDKGLPFPAVLDVIKNYQKCYITLKQDDKSIRFAFIQYMKMFMLSNPDKFLRYFPHFMD